jgi:hypothetical protein
MKEEKNGIEKEKKEVIKQLRGVKEERKYCIFFLSLNFLESKCPFVFFFDILFLFISLLPFLTWFVSELLFLFFFLCFFCSVFFVMRNINKPKLFLKKKDV